MLARWFLSVKSGRSGTHLAPEHRVNFSPLADRRLPGSQAPRLTGSLALISAAFVAVGTRDGCKTLRRAQLEICFMLNFCHGLYIDIATLQSKVFQVKKRFQTLLANTEGLKVQRTACRFKKILQSDLFPLLPSSLTLNGAPP